jgi:hypothetical protein
VQGSSKGSVSVSSLQSFSRLLHRLKPHGFKQNLVDCVDIEARFGDFSAFFAHPFNEVRVPYKPFFY